MARLLFVDDDPAQTNVWRLLLETAGHQFAAATTLSEAFDRLAAAPDVLIMDLRLPEVKDGLLLIRTAAECAPVKIVVLSGWPEDLERKPEAKLVARVLVKPARPPALLRAIAELAG
jgi:CheY-like chemotaxis protein